FGSLAEPTDASFGSLAEPTDASFGSLAEPTDASFGSLAEPTDAYRGGVTATLLRSLTIAGAVVAALIVPPVPARAARTPGALVAPVQLVPAEGTTIAVHGLHRYFGRIGIGTAADGLVVTNRLPLERYLLGLNEVPPGWPEEALRAQAVAARTYALWTLGRPPGGAAATYGFDICASVECQVFSGADVTATPDGPRWAAAVRDTAGDAVLYAGAPILARYHSTSGGTTLDNSQAFPGEPDYPYLQSVPSRTETASPLYRWEATFPLRRLEAMLRGGALWTDAQGTLKRVSTVPSRAGLHYPDVLLRGTRGNVRVDAEALRDVLRVEAPALYPGLYPSLWPTTSGRLPETLPSNRISIVTNDRAAIVRGRGWGHGTGMSQWGAHGLASQGASYREILAHYYRGTTVGDAPAPRSISVGIAWGQTQVVATGEFDVLDRDGVAIPDALGTWTFAPAGAGVVSVRPPKGHALPLRLVFVRAPKEVTPGARVSIEFALSKPARLGIEGARPAAVRAPGRGRLDWRAPDEPGSYEVTVVASAGRESERRSLEIGRSAPGRRAPTGARGRRRRCRWPRATGPGRAASRPRDRGPGK
ncbi:MAG: SpoIID/LytB domain-containing protein, partial [Actinomycetota bacterium]|nr:SpoIID/LytB domain-containing protein [Actinomycetota bacterium]